MSDYEAIVHQCICVDFIRKSCKFSNYACIFIEICFVISVHLSYRMRFALFAP